MIRSFGDKRTEALFRDDVVRQFQSFVRPAKRKLEAINAASRLEDLKVPPANRLEKLKGNLKDFYSIRINDQWRVIFKWVDGEARDVRITSRTDPYERDSRIRLPPWVCDGEACLRHGASLMSAAASKDASRAPFRERAKCHHKEPS